MPINLEICGVNKAPKLPTNVTATMFYGSSLYIKTTSSTFAFRIDSVTGNSAFKASPISSVSVLISGSLSALTVSCLSSTTVSGFFSRVVSANAMRITGNIGGDALLVVGGTAAFSSGSVLNGTTQVGGDVVQSGAYYIQCGSGSFKSNAGNVGISAVFNTGGVFNLTFENGLLVLQE